MRRFLRSFWKMAHSTVGLQPAAMAIYNTYAARVPVLIGPSLQDRLDATRGPVVLVADSNLRRETGRR